MKATKTHYVNDIENQRDIENLIDSEVGDWVIVGKTSRYLLFSKEKVDFVIKDHDLVPKDKKSKDKLDSLKDNIEQLLAITDRNNLAEASVTLNISEDKDEVEVMKFILLSSPKLKGGG